MSVTGEPDGRPLKVGAALIDMLCGLHASVGILAALRARERDGLGQRVEASLMDSALAALLNQASALPQRRHGARAAWATATRRSRPTRPSRPPTATSRSRSATTRCSRRLCDVIDRPELAGDERFATNTARLEHRDALGALLNEAFAAAPGRGLGAAAAAPPACPAGPIHDVAQAFAFAEELGLEPVDETDGVRTVRPVARLSRTPADVRRRPPRLGEHDAEIRAWLAGPIEPRT